MSLLKSCRWSLKGKGQVENLVRLLREYNDDLYRFCSWEAQWQINRSLPTLALRQNNDSTYLHLIADAVENEAADENSPTMEGRRRLAEMARFKAKVMTRRPGHRWQLLDNKVYALLCETGPWSLAIDVREGKAVFVEWQSYLDDDVRGGHGAKEQICDLGDFLCVPNRPTGFRTLKCIGLFDQSDSRRYGVVYQLPSHLEEPDATKPASLRDLVRCATGLDKAPALGARFDLARKLVNTIVVLHTCGWLHKKICPNNVLFFFSLERPGQQAIWEKDISDPFIMGYGLSRPDDIVGEDGRERVPRRSRRDEEPNAKRPRFSHADERAKEAALLSIYQHPDKVENPDSRFRHSYDVYSLGLVLLEIGLWQSLEELDFTQVKNNYQFRSYVLSHLVPKLWGRCGTIYHDVVRECLKMRTNDCDLVEEGQRRLAWSIAERLDSCVA